MHVLNSMFYFGIHLFSGDLEYGFQYFRMQMLVLGIWNSNVLLLIWDSRDGGFLVYLLEMRYLECAVSSVLLLIWMVVLMFAVQKRC